MERMEFAGAGVTIVADAAGAADAPLVLFLHGGGQTRQSWGKALEVAAERGYRAVSLDLRGHGESGWSDDGAYSMPRFADDVRNVIAALGRPPVIVGASLGGLIGILIASVPSPEVRGLVLVDVAVRLETEGTREIGAFMQSAPDGFASLDDAADAVSAYLPHRTRPKDTSGLMRNLRLRENGRLHWHWDPAFTRYNPETAKLTANIFAQAAASLTVPVLLIRGGRSRVLSAEGVAEFRELVPHAEYVDVAGADHMVAGDANDSFNDAVLGFLAQHAHAAQ
ncbi:peroxidase [Acidocella aquatica]|uniref:Peroxidase n=1 Tax=Acidocella aquatica TaxID=1922313 RepID=A0ABQ6A741_9PROT|nr:alpha/beta hydrolase [Acidocella aquatica]GLR68260.1 peroxidase [Acidocella aquatica]